MHYRACQRQKTCPWKDFELSHLVLSFHLALQTMSIIYQYLSSITITIAVLVIIPCIVRCLILCLCPPDRALIGLSVSTVLKTSQAFASCERFSETLAVTEKAGKQQLKQTPPNGIVMRRYLQTLHNYSVRCIIVLERFQIHMGEEATFSVIRHQTWFFHVRKGSSHIHVDLR